MFDYMQVETAHIQTIDTLEDLTALCRSIKRSPKRLVDAEGPQAHQPKKLNVYVTSTMGDFDIEHIEMFISCSYGSDHGYMLATLGDTVITYADGTFCILPTGTPARVAAPLA